MARTAKRYKKNTEKKISGIPVCMVQFMPDYP